MIERMDHVGVVAADLRPTRAIRLTFRTRIAIGHHRRARARLGCGRTKKTQRWER